MTDEQISAVIEESDGHWVDDDFRINGKDLMNLCRAVALLSASKPVAPAQSGEPVAWREEAQRLFDRCKLWPEETGDGFMALLELRNHVGALLENAASAQSGSRANTARLFARITIWIARLL